uniref:Predicted protein putative n=1 Tax=Albugo laibachii Nc14 TaxID=890382 RepID=F0WX63_9STRA|nr:predicted protein putative [Albugo laibachii Nc14]|eukprot:CCA26054.1 predicted protein putative [Albugo laibachii Nc14]
MRNPMDVNRTYARDSSSIHFDKERLKWTRRQKVSHSFVTISIKFNDYLFRNLAHQIHQDDAHVLASVEIPFETLKKSHQRSGRRPSAVWEYFSQLRMEHNKLHAQCKFCSFRCAGVASRMVHHILFKCPHAPENVQLSCERDKQTKRTREIHSSNTTFPTKQKMKLHRDPKSANLVTYMNDMHAGSQVQSTGLIEHWNLFLERFINACAFNNIPVRFLKDEDLREAFQKFASIVEVASVNGKEGCTSLCDKKCHSGRQLWTDPVDGLMTLYKQLGSDIDELIQRAQYITLVQRIQQADSVDIMLFDDRRQFDLWISSESSKLVDSPCQLLRLTLEKALFQLEVRVSQSCMVNLCIPEMCSTVTDALSKNGRLKLVGSCLTRQTFHMLKKLLSAGSGVISTLQDASRLIDSLITLEQQEALTYKDSFKLDSDYCRRQFMQFQLPKNDDSAHISCNYVPVLIGRLLNVQQQLQDALIRDNYLAHTNENQRISQHRKRVNDYFQKEKHFWCRLFTLHEALKPFVWLFAASETLQVSSSQVLECWLWILSVIHDIKSSLKDTRSVLTSEEVDAFELSWLEIVQESIQEHQLASLMLDPRIHGTGLSSVGRRKVNNMIVNLHDRLYVYQACTMRHPSDPDTVSNSEETSITRRALLDQLSHYINKKGIFEDSVTWEMSRTNASPEWFWSDFEQDATILSKLAKCVLLYIPQVESASSFFKHAYGTIQRFSALSEDDFNWRQLCHHFRHNSGNHSGARNTPRAYAEALFPYRLSSIQSARTDNLYRVSGSVVKHVNDWISCVMESEQQSCTSTHESCGHRPKGDSDISLSWFTYESEQDRHDLEVKASSFFTLPTDALNINSTFPNHWNKKMNTPPKDHIPSNATAIASSTMVI